MLELVNKIEFSYEDLDEAFPACDPGHAPLGSRVLVQIRTPKRKTAGGIHLLDEVRETEAWNTQVAKVLAVGPVAFHSRKDLTPWPEGAWVAVGDFVRVPKYGGDRWTVKTGKFDEVYDPGTDSTYKGEEIQVMVALFNDLDLVAKVTCDPREIRAFI